MAKRLEFTLAHSYDADELRARLQALSDYFLNKYNATVTWTDSTCRIVATYMMIPIDLEATLLPTRVDVVGRDPGMLLRKRALAYMRQKTTRYLDPSTPLEALPTS